MIKTNADNQGAGKHKPPCSAPSRCSSARHHSLLFSSALQGRAPSSAPREVTSNSPTLHILSLKGIFSADFSSESKKEIKCINYPAQSYWEVLHSPSATHPEWANLPRPSRRRWECGNGRGTDSKQRLLTAHHELGASMLSSMEIILSWRRKIEVSPILPTRHCKTGKAF